MQIAVTQFFDLKELVWNDAPKGQVRRSLLGMLNTKGEFAVFNWLQNHYAKQGGKYKFVRDAKQWHLSTS